MTAPGTQEWLDQVIEDVVEPELEIIDPHHHLWDLRPMVPMFPEPHHPFIAAIAPNAYYTFDELRARYG